MTPLRQRMLQELQRRNYSPSTIRSYLGAAQQFAEHFHCSPEQLGPEHLRGYQVFLLQEKKLEPSTVEIRISALRFLSKRTLRRRDFTKPCAGLLVELCDHGGRQNDRCDSFWREFRSWCPSSKDEFHPILLHMRQMPLTKPPSRLRTPGSKILTAR